MVAAGETVIGLVVAPLLQEYVVPPVPPVAVNVAVPPGQMVGEFTFIVKAEPTVTVAMSVPVQPAFVAVTVYEVVVAGETLIGFVVAPLLQE